MPLLSLRLVFAASVRLVLGVVFFLAASYKIANPGSFLRAISQVTFLPVLPWWVKGAIGGLIVGAECMIVWAMLTGRRLALASLVCIFILAVFTLGAGPMADGAASCGCMWEWSPFHVSTLTGFALRNSLMMLAAALLLVHRVGSRVQGRSIRFAPMVLGATLLLAVASWSAAAQLADDRRDTRVADADARGVVDYWIPGTLATPLAARDAQPTPARVVVAATQSALEHRIRGIVVDTWDRPVAAASVTAAKPAWIGFRFLDPALQPSLRAGSTVVCDAAGRFDMPVVDAELHVVTAYASGHGPATIDACCAGQDVVLRLGRICTIAGVIADHETRKPLEGARIIAKPVAGRRAPLECRSASDGSYRLEVGEGSYNVLAYSPAAVTWRTSQPITVKDGEWRSLDIEVHQGLLVQGRVVDALSGDPLAGAEVSDGASFWARVVRSDSEGRFSMGGVVPVGPGTLYVRHPGYVTAGCVVDARTQVVVALERGSLARGRVVDESGRGMANVRVGCETSRSAGPWSGGHVHFTDWRLTETDASGSFSLTGLQPGATYLVVAWAAGLGRSFQTVVGLPAGQSTSIEDIVMASPCRLEGRVKSVEDVPIPNARVRLTPAVGLRTDAATVETSSDRDGRFELGDLSRGAYSLHISMDDAEIATAGVAFSRPGERRTHDVVVSVSPLRIVVRTPDGGAAPPEMSVTVLGESTGKRRSVTLQGNQEGVVHGLGDDVVTVAVEPLSLARSPYCLTVVEHAAVHSGAVQVVLSPAATVRGRVVFARPRPCRGLRVHHRRSGLVTWSSRGIPLDDRGVFEAGVAAGHAHDFCVVDPTSEMKLGTIQRVVCSGDEIVIQVP